MPRFPVPFGKRRSTADSFDNAPVAGPSFRVLERTELSNVKTFDGGRRVPAKGLSPPTDMAVELPPLDDNIFADLKNNRGSGVSNNTAKSSLTDNSSRHSNASTAPSSTTDPSPLDETKGPTRKPYGDIPVPPIPKSASNNFLKAAGRTFSFGGQKKGSHPDSVPEEPMTRPFTADVSPEQLSTVGRARATTSSTSSTATPPKLEEDIDLGGDFSKMLSFDKRQSVMTLKDDGHGRQALGPRSLTGSRLNQPAPLQIDKSSRIEASPLSWNSHTSGEGLLVGNSVVTSPTNENVPPPVPRHGSNGSGRSSQAATSLKRRSATYGQRNEAEAEDEDTSLLKDISTVTKFLSANSTQTQGSGRYRRHEDTLGAGFRQVSSDSQLSRLDNKDDDNLFDTSLAASSRLANRYITRRPSPPSPPRNKVMTPAQFERYRQDKERRASDSDDAAPSKDNDEDEINYDDDEDEIEKSKQAAKQRRKQEAHMAVYRQQMMKVTGEAATGVPSRPGISMSLSTPNLLNAGGPSPPKSNAASEGEEEDEEVPLAILAAHGFPNKNRPPTRLNNMLSNPNLKAAAQTPSYQRAGSVAGDNPGPGPAAQAGSGGRLPVFARNLPQDPYIGAGLINHAPRESLSFSGGAPAPAAPPGGLVGVIANEERSRALRRGSPAIDAHKPMLSMGNSSGFDPLAGIPSQMMYPNGPQPISTTEQAQLQMNQQMTQFMQMQMQFMQMMASQTAGSRMSQVMQTPPIGMMNGPGGMPGMGGPDTIRHSFMDSGSVYDLPIRPESHVRSMSMVQPSSASWIQPPPQPGYAPSIRVQGANGYAPSIAPSERSNIGLPGRYRPVSHTPAPRPSMSPVPSPSPLGHGRNSSNMSGALGGWEQQRTKSPLQNTAATTQASDEEDEEQGWADMKQKREKKRSLWKTKKSIGSEISALIR